MTSAKKEWLSILGMYVLAAVFFLQMPEDEPNGALFPGMMIFLMTVFASIKVVIQLMQPKEVPDGKKREPFPFVRIIAVIAGTIVYIAVIEPLGFYTSSFIFFFLASTLVQKGKREPKAILTRAAVCFGFTLFLYALFAVLLLVQTPKGILF